MLIGLTLGDIQIDSSFYIWLMLFTIHFHIDTTNAEDFVAYLPFHLLWVHFDPTSICRFDIMICGIGVSYMYDDEIVTGSKGEWSIIYTGQSLKMT